jgi:hypothetical protein
MRFELFIVFDPIWRTRLWGLLLWPAESKWPTRDVTDSMGLPATKYYIDIFPKYSIIKLTRILIPYGIRRTHDSAIVLPYEVNTGFYLLLATSTSSLFTSIFYPGLALTFLGGWGECPSMNFIDIYNYSSALYCVSQEFKNERELGGNVQQFFFFHLKENYSLL